jgi:osmotically-inducible protein OsmY
MNIFDRLSSTARDRADDARDRARMAITGERRRSPAGMVVAGMLGALAGAGAALLLDPQRGRARRARLVDQGGAAVRRAARQGEQLVRRVRSDVTGRLAASRAAGARDVRPIDDATLTDRIQSTIFRDDAVPKGTLNVNVERGIVVLRGEVPDEAMRSRIVAEVEAIEGVWSVRDLLHLPGEPAPTAVVAS